MCEVLEVSGSGNYAWRGRQPSAAAKRREKLVTAIQAIYAEPHNDTDGSLRVREELKAQEMECCVNTVADVMKQVGIRAVSKPQRVRTTDSNHDQPVAENVLDRDFMPEKPIGIWGSIRWSVWETLSVLHQLGEKPSAESLAALLPEV